MVMNLYSLESTFDYIKFKMIKFESHFTCARINENGGSSSKQSISHFDAIIFRCDYSNTAVKP
jgi:hypothetical protein